MWKWVKGPADYNFQVEAQAKSIVRLTVTVICLLLNMYFRSLEVKCTRRIFGSTEPTHFLSIRPAREHCPVLDK